MDDISIYLTSDLTSSERRISPNWTLEYFKKRMEQITGIPTTDQRVWVYKTRDTSERTEIKAIGSDLMTNLSDFQIVPFTRIHIENTNENSELHELEKDLIEDDANDSTKDGLYKLDEEQYDKLSNTVKKWKQQNRLGKYDPNFHAQKENQIAKNLEKSKTLSPGDRCKITNPSDPTDLERFGSIRYVGSIPEIDQGESVWVGVELDKPFGKNDGSVKGTRYFTCQPNFGSFVKPVVVEKGYFPAESIFDGLESSDEDEL